MNLDDIYPALNILRVGKKKGKRREEREERKDEPKIVGWFEAVTQVKML